jgi:predicted protein tyrosine phosphatase
MMAAEPPKEPWAVISICERGNFPDIQENDQMQGRLNLQFHDADQFAYEADNVRIIFFDQSHAEKILDFYEEMAGLGVRVMYVHCLMGQARSAAVAAALEKALYGDDSRYFANGFYKPNMRVFRGVLDECHTRGLIG